MLLENIRKLSFFRWLWLYFLALCRIDDYAICCMSQDRDGFDFHDYTDSNLAVPMHFCYLECARCGKKFRI